MRNTKAINCQNTSANFYENGFFVWPRGYNLATGRREDRSFKASGGMEIVVLNPVNNLKK